MISLAQGIAQQIPTLLPMAVQAIGQFVIGLVQMLPMVMQTGLMLIMNLVQGIISSLPQIIAYGVQAIVQFITGLVQMLPMVLQSGAQMILALLQAIIANIPALIQGGVQIIIALAGGLLQGIPQIINSAGQLVDSIIMTILTTDWIGLALDIVESIGEGIVNGVKSLFGVGEEAGEEVGEGVAAGVANSTSTATYAAQNLSSQTTSSLQLNTPTIESFGVVGVNSLANGITSGGSLAQGAATNISALTSTGFGTSLTDLSAVGMQATTSLAGGITANAGTAVGAASTMKSQVENAAATEVEVKINADTASLESFQSAISSFASQAAAGIQEVPAGVFGSYGRNQLCCAVKYGHFEHISGSRDKCYEQRFVCIYSQPYGFVYFWIYSSVDNHNSHNVGNGSCYEQLMQSDDFNYIILCFFYTEHICERKFIQHRCKHDVGTYLRHECYGWLCYGDSKQHCESGGSSY